MRHGEAVEETTSTALRSGAASNEYTQSLIQASQGFTRDAKQPTQAMVG
jgi:peptide/nickel transport system ATP-binding protein